MQSFLDWFYSLEWERLVPELVRKNCIRCFLVKPADLKLFHDWNWCRDNVLVEKPWHWFRVVALHRIACCWREEQDLTAQEATQSREKVMPLVDRQVRHDRVRLLSVGINTTERPVGQPHTIDWSKHVPELEKMGLSLAMRRTEQEVEQPPLLST
jgi:hypothetical protein